MKKKKKLGLSLGSGGIKGAAHIGALRAFQEAGIKFDIVAGTSIGSIVGALYARGYSWEDISRLKDEVLSIGKQELLAISIGGFVNAMKKLVGDACFDDLKIPFAAVATDADSGEEYVMRDGLLASALAASCAVPPFPAVKRDGRVLVDGAFVNYVPSDVVKDIGADIVVGINLGKGSDFNHRIKMTLDATYPKNGVKEGLRSGQFYRFTDVFIEPELKGLVKNGLAGVEEMTERGYTAAMEKIPEIRKILK